MFFIKFRKFVVRLASVSLILAGFGQVSFGSVVGTEYLVDSEQRTESIERVAAFLAEESFATQLEALGVDSDSIDARLAGLTTAELLELEGRIDQQVAGGDALAVVGTVFVVLLVLELVGVTDIFKSI